ncbi:alpha-L-fucosidase [Chryseobacterium piperi]|uniref:Alpha-L-fucosidase n=1 Tax=Chryseobacterium piperi TaxID=558152 RepID=A0A086B9P0_9FLAO|nr:glycoside hydrolase family 95 protein [Chryseobacterium piperi]ASW73597.1 alpha-L-fucosidase [Chryseobacterium piperi]KFF25654.1 alpha-L-fucosidase [Chryseobacterium piperi]
MKLIRCLILGVLSICGNAYAQSNDPLRLWYDRPATVWEEALPLGNGKTGAMVYGRVGRERIALNDNTLWSGFPSDGNNPDGPKILPQVRTAIDEEQYDRAAMLWKKMQGPYSARYLSLGELFLKFNHLDTIPEHYQRELNLQNAISTVRYSLNGISYKREILTSFPGKALIMRITADKPGSISFTAGLLSKLRFQTKVSGTNELTLKGKAPKFVANRSYEPEQIIYDEKEGMTFQICLKIKNEGGSLTESENQLTVKNANAVTIYLTEATSFNGFDKSPGLEGKDPAIESQDYMNQVFSQSFEKLKTQHINDYQELFNRVKFNLSSNPAAEKQTTDKRLKQYAKDKNDQGLQVLYYQFGRYLMIASSRPGSRPSNLQGIWNDHIQPPWGSNYTININTEMNYWPAENTNLSECHLPLLDFIKELSVNGARTAKVNYNIDKGWVAHHNSDLWAKTSPAGNYDTDKTYYPAAFSWQMGGAWLSLHLFEHYQFNRDQQFLKDTAYPLMKGAAIFMLQWLVKDRKSGYLVTNPSTSPENLIKIDGKEYALSMASTMDMSILRELFTALIQSAEILKTDLAFRGELITAREKLYPFQIGQYGQLQEWYRDWDDPKDKHRHISHLFSLFPGNQISVFKTPELASAAKQSLIYRGDVSTGWSMAWKINWWARLQDGNHAYKILEDAFTYVDPTLSKTQGRGGTYPNLFDAHPPFQIDGNFGATAGITEMLLQSHDDMISLLPALPQAWKEGHINGIKARGNFILDIAWKEGKLSSAFIKSEAGETCRLRTLQRVKVVEVKTGEGTYEKGKVLLQKDWTPPYQNHPKSALQKLDIEPGYILDFKTEKGKTYQIIVL